MAEFCYLGWYMAVLVQFPVIFLGEKKKNKGLILHPKAKQASVRILRIYVNVQKSFQLRKQGDLPEQTVICYRKLFQQWICYM